MKGISRQTYVDKDYTPSVTESNPLANLVVQVQRHHFEQQTPAVGTTGLRPHAPAGLEDEASSNN
jgi:hypothetical protein